MNKKSQPVTESKFKEHIDKELEELEQQKLDLRNKFPIAIGSPYETKLTVQIDEEFYSPVVWLTLTSKFNHITLDSDMIERLEYCIEIRDKIEKLRGKIRELRRLLD